jgi:hypothetical protein
MRLFPNIDETLFIIFNITITCQNFRIKKPSVEVKISNLIIYSTICCQNGNGIMVLAQLLNCVYN